jgi:RNA polymerase sigma-70 factor (ECF subfamily)
MTGTVPTTEVPTDEGLIADLIGGSHDALAALYDRHADNVFAVAMHATRDHGIAADVVQETFLALWDRAERFDPSRGSLTAWLATIARNRAIDHLRAIGRHHRAAAFSSYASNAPDSGSTLDWIVGSGELIGSAAPEPTPDAAVSDGETRAAIRDAVASLDPLERAVIELAYGGDLTQAEIATRLGWPIGTVKTRTRRALRRLRDRLEAPPVGAPPAPAPAAAALALAATCAASAGIACH